MREEEIEQIVSKKVQQSVKNYLDSLQVIQETKDYKIVKIYKESINDSGTDSLHNFSTGDSYKTKEYRNYRTKLLQE